jgi:hypothetical protein
MDWSVVAYYSFLLIVPLLGYAFSVTLRAASLSQTAEANIRNKQKILIQHRDRTIWGEYQHFSGEFNQTLNKAKRLNSKDEVSILRKSLKKLGKRIMQYERDLGSLTIREKQCSQHSIFLHGGLYPLLCFLLASMSVIISLSKQDVPKFYIGGFNVYVVGLGWRYVGELHFYTLQFCLAVAAILVVLGLYFLLQRLICIYRN